LAFIQKKGNSYRVLRGAPPFEVLQTFSGKDAKRKAQVKVLQLHREHKPKVSAKGQNAIKAFRKSKQMNKK
jgi:hypothetical protein